MKIAKALALSLGKMNSPAITQYQLGLLVFHLYINKQYDGEALNVSKPYAERPDYLKLINTLRNEGILIERSGFPSGTYSLIGMSNPSPEDLICTIDPFCYLSHLSAMSYHGLTDRIPSKLFVSSPSPKDWKAYAQQKMAKDLGDDLETYQSSQMPSLARLKTDRLAGTDIHVHHSKHLGAYKNVRGRNLRVSTIGRTFLDMIRKPDLCGGINHVLHTYDQHAPKYLKLITNEIEQHGKAIDKVRAGYILEERLKLEDDTVKSWKNFAQRGGSRKLDASEEYIPKWSETWCLSLNIFE
jgi:predicted transcriptional regulator of viral defense system